MKWLLDHQPDVLTRLGMSQRRCQYSFRLDHCNLSELAFLRGCISVPVWLNMKALAGCIRIDSLYKYLHALLRKQSLLLLIPGNLQSVFIVSGQLVVPFDCGLRGWNGQGWNRLWTVDCQADVRRRWSIVLAVERSSASLFQGAAIKTANNSTIRRSAKESCRTFKSKQTIASIVWSQK